MKKFTKICLIASLVLILIGGSICAIGFFSGGFRLVNAAAKNSVWWDWIDEITFDYEWEDDYGFGIREEVNDSIEEAMESVEDVWDDTWDEAWDEVKQEWSDHTDDFDDHMDEWDDYGDYDDEWEAAEFASLHGTDIPKEYLDTGIVASEISDLKITVGGAMVYLAESDNDHFGVQVDGNEKYKYAEDNGVFYLQGVRKRLHANDMSFVENEKVYLYIPKGMKFRDVDITIGGGLVQIAAMDADDMDLNIGAGVVTSEKINCRSLELEVGAGKSILKGVETSELSMNVGMGEAAVAATVADKIDVECGMGQVNLKLGNKETDYNYRLNCTAGGIDLNGKSYKGLGKEQYINNSAAGECELECAMGSIRVAFEE